MFVMYGTGTLFFSVESDFCIFWRTGIFNGMKAPQRKIYSDENRNMFLKVCVCVSFQLCYETCCLSQSWFSVIMLMTKRINDVELDEISGIIRESYQVFLSLNISDK